MEPDHAQGPNRSLINKPPSQGSPLRSWPACNSAAATRRLRRVPAQAHASKYAHPSRIGFSTLSDNRPGRQRRRPAMVVRRRRHSIVIGAKRRCRRERRNHASKLCARVDALASGNRRPSRASPGLSSSASSPRRPDCSHCCEAIRMIDHASRQETIIPRPLPTTLLVLRQVTPVAGRVIRLDDRGAPGSTPAAGRSALIAVI